VSSVSSPPVRSSTLVNVKPSCVSVPSKPPSVRLTAVSTIDTAIW